MSIAGCHYKIFEFLRQSNNLPQADSILEIGEQNWYGDIDPLILLNGISKFSPDEQKNNFCDQVRSILDKKEKTWRWDLAKSFYKIFFSAKEIQSIDMHGTPSALPLDLNRRHDLGKKYDAIINLGTAEHIFDVRQLFESMHNWLKVGGYAYHCLPMHGEIDHGFYNFHPTFYWDLAHANKYKLIIAKVTTTSVDFFRDRKTLHDNIKAQDASLSYGIFAVTVKTCDNAFSIPRQGVYDDDLPGQGDIFANWKEQRNISERPSRN